MRNNERNIKDCGGNKYEEVVPKNNITELVFILDRSGSMAGFEKDTIGGFNSTIEKQKKQNGKVYVSTVLFDNVSEVIHDRVDISEIKPMTDADYEVRGCTALLDAVGDSIKHIKRVQGYMPEEYKAGRVIFVITTDGEENASRKYTRAAVKKMIGERTEKYGWEFLFVSANIDSEESGAAIGISEDRCASYLQTEEGFAECYAAMDSFVTMARSAKGATRDVSWRKDLEKNKKKK